MQITIDPQCCLDNLENIETEIEQQNFDGALARYLEKYGEIAGKARVERKLARLAVGKKEIGNYPKSWPDGITQRISGAVLVFAAAQIAHTDIELPQAFKHPGRIPSEDKKCLADAWEIRPACTCLNEPEFLNRFAVCLATEAETAGPCLIAAATRNETDSGLLDWLARNWLARGLSGPRTPEYISKTMKTDRLRKIAGRAVGRAVVHFWENAPALAELQRTAFELEEYGTAIACGDILQNLVSDPESLRNSLAIRLASLAETNRTAEAVEEYRSLWQPSGEAFPFPGHLLYAFQHEGAADQERHLLETGIFNEYTPEWVVLSKALLKAFLSESGITGLVRKWAELYRKESGDARVLIGFTKAVLALPALQRGKLAAALAARWENLLKYNAYKLTAGAFLTLLQETDEGRIETFERHLDNADLSHFAVRPAARFYVRALCRRKKWDKLRAWLDNADIEATFSTMLSVAPFEECEFIRIMAIVAKLPETGTELNHWCRHWERLIGLPVRTDMLTETFGHYINLRRQLQSGGNFPGGDDFLEDLTLQLLRRARAEAEIIIRTDRFPENERKTYAARLKKSTLEGTHTILMELSPYYRHELETIRWYGM